ncbi:MAG: aldehyde dehydrogenase family protein [Pirellulales bacterium]|nr:aldehyde dehydrogenase family protein [Pirellulales bacterium]
MAIATHPVRTPKITETGLFIDGRFQPSAGGKTFPTINPATEEVLAEISEGTAEDVDRAVRAARRALQSGPWATMDARDRGSLLLQLADAIQQEREELAVLETLDNGKRLADSRVDVTLCVEALRYYAGYADKIYGKTIPVRGPFFTYTRREPVGVAGQIIPWNFPMVNVVWKWAPALAAGCTVVLKPAEQTPLTALRLARIAKEAGIPDGVVNVVPGGPATGAAIVRHPGVDKIAFTGSCEVGQTIMREAASTLKRVTLELGGKSPNILFADCDLDTAIAQSHNALYWNQGQVCASGSRLFVEDKIYDQVVEKIAERNRKYKVGDPFDPETEQGPQVDRAQFEKVLDYIGLGKHEGAECLTGGGRFGNRGYYVEPTLFANVKDEMVIAREEIFGPVLCALRFSDVEEVIERANNTTFGLAAAVWTRDITKAHRLANRIKAGTVWINCYYGVDLAAPFGGYRMSGLGRELGEEGILGYTELKTVAVKLA